MSFTENCIICHVSAIYNSATSKFTNMEIYFRSYFSLIFILVLIWVLFSVFSIILANVICLECFSFLMLIISKIIPYVVGSVMV